MIATAVLGCAIFAGTIAAKILDAPTADEPTDQFNEPFGDVPHVVLHDNGDFLGWVHGERE
jgi:hypothetical protein